MSGAARAGEVNGMTEPRRDEELQAWKRALRRATLYTYGFLIAAVLVAVGGTALVALLLTRSGLPFGPTWPVLLAIVVVGVALGMWLQRRNR